MRVLRARTSKLDFEQLKEANNLVQTLWLQDFVQAPHKNLTLQNEVYLGESYCTIIA